MKKFVKVPTNLVSGTGCQHSLKLDGCSVIDSCVHSTKGSGSMFLEEHLLLFVLAGKITFYHGKQVYTLGRNKMILFRKQPTSNMKRRVSRKMIIFTKA
ncbi:MAG: hypothetical protein LUD02_05140 [Tannerellaceae bacterium]|nr:hypothetical protein [Tannerellaceae bacterium]